MTKLLWKIIKKGRITPVTGLQLATRVLGLGGFILVLCGAVLGFWLGAERVRQKWNLLE